MKLPINRQHLSRGRVGGQHPYITVYEPILFPFTKNDLVIGKTYSRVSLESALAGDRNLLICYKRNPNTDHVSIKDLHVNGTLCYISNFLRYPDGTVRISIEGCNVVELVNVQIAASGLQSARYRTVEFKIPRDKQQYHTLLMVLKESFSEYMRDNRQLPRELIKVVGEAKEPKVLMSLICMNVKMSRSKKLYFLSHLGSLPHLEELAITLGIEREVVQIKEGLSSKVRQRLDQSQKEYILQEQLKEIYRELGSADDDVTGSKELEQRLGLKDLPDGVRDKVTRELKRLRSLQPASPESSMLRAYLELIEELPWGKAASEDRVDIMAAQAILDSDHYGLEEPKERILDYLAVRGISSGLRAPILCLVGPPGTGKTSLARSIAKTLNRCFVRIALGGVRDEAEIRGHRRTYVGALPGKIIQAFKRVHTTNLVILLDEVDKISNDFRGDPGAALLEVLDIEQNYAFVDHYLELPYDLSNVLFVATANNIEDIDLPMLDRMEIIEIPGYTIYDKKNIAREHLIPRQMIENGIGNCPFELEEGVLDQIIAEYTMESGVRNLERAIAKIIRKLVRAFLRKQETRAGSYARNSAFLHQNRELFRLDYNNPEAWDQLLREHKWEVTAKDVTQYLGTPIFDPFDLTCRQIKGLALGMAWTAVGGRLLPVEVLKVRGNGGLTLTGKLGEVMKESAQIAYSVIQQVFSLYGIAEDILDNADLHIHVPEGAVPKDGSSAGITIASAMLSALSGISVRPGVAMTGEVTLTNQLLAVGGIREKVLAAHRQGIKDILLPEKNRWDAEKLPEIVQNSIEFHYFSSVLDAIYFLLPNPEILGEKKENLEDISDFC